MSGNHESFRLMRSSTQRGFAVVGVGLTLALLCDAAFAFRCGNRVVQDGMHEAEVVRLCGEPVSTRDLGYVIRSYSYGKRSLYPGKRPYPANYGQYHHEVLVTEMLFNFGPRKLMRRLTFEGGILTSIRTMGYGYIEKDKR